MNIVWFCSWYPNKYDKYTGDFIQRQAIALGEKTNTSVLYINTQASKNENELFENNFCTESLVYFRKTNFLIKWYNYFKAHFSFIKKYIKLHGKPSLIQANIAMPSGLAALFIKKIFKIPYIVSEHYGIYNTIANDNFYTRNFLFRYFTKVILKNSNGIITVSKSLGNDIEQTAGIKSHYIVSNVVDENIFTFKSKPKLNVFKFLHVSGMDSNKNVKGIIDACVLLKTNSNLKFELHLVGGMPQSLIQYTKELNIYNDIIFFYDSVSQDAIAKFMHESHCFILFSNSETQSCVVLESLCTGTPVISSSVGGAAELLDVKNGIYVAPNDVENLKNAMQKIINSYSEYNLEEISVNAQKHYSKKTIHNSLVEVYKEVLKKS